MTGWLLVLAAALAEVLGVIGLKKFSLRRSGGHLLMFSAGFAASFALLYRAFDYLPMSTAYAVWIGLGTAAAVVVNMLFFGESRRPARLFALLLIVVGVTGLKALS